METGVSKRHTGDCITTPRSHPSLPFAVWCLLLSAFCLLFLLACGYHVAGTATRIPPDVKTIAVPAFKNMTSTFRIEQQLTSAVTREFLERTHYRIIPNPAEADAVLRGTVKDVRARAITFDVNTGRATSLQVQVTADVKLEEVHSHKLLFSNSNYVFREEYQVNESPTALFEEDKPALERLSRDLARTLVTDILENF
jgi:outer membrane lipopolysaccharide assembly protein LptE/RlpB